MGIKNIESTNPKIYKENNVSNNNMLPGDLKRSPDESFNSTLIFIDGGFLSKLSHHFGGGKYLIYDIFKFAQNLCKKQNLKCGDIFYYTAPPFQSDNPTKEEEARKEGYDKFINKLKQKRIIIREGRCQRLLVKNKFEYNQKAVDILLTMDLMTVPLKYSEINRIILISSDSDFVPVVKKLEESNIKTILYTYYEKKRDTNFSRSNYLVKSVYKYKLLTKQDFNFPLN